MKSLPGKKPTVGLTPDFDVGPPPVLKLKHAYAEAVLRLGGVPLVLPLTDDKPTLEAYLERLSGLIITGGAFDVPPELYGEAPREGLGPLNPLRTAFELALLKLAIARKLPVLGICGGMQLINVCYGGTLVQDLARERPLAKSHEQTHERHQPQHPVEVKEGSALAEGVGKGQLMVNSTHHQAIDAVGPGLTVCAAAPDGVIEAVESSDGLVLGVQWHPELLIDTVPVNLGVYKVFLQRARQR